MGEVKGKSSEADSNRKEAYKFQGYPAIASYCDEGSDVEEIVLDELLSQDDTGKELTYDELLKAAEEVLEVGLHPGRTRHFGCARGVENATELNLDTAGGPLQARESLLAPSGNRKLLRRGGA